MKCVMNPLTPSDTVSVDSLGLTIGYVVDRAGKPFLEPFVVDEALRRVADKWRMLAGRVQWQKALNVWGIQVPVDETLPSSYRTHAFTHAISDEILDLPTICPDTTTITSRPDIKLFRDPSTPTANAEYEKRDAPIVSVHLTTLAHHPDTILLGLSFPHGVFDATGMGQVAAALQAELERQAWTAPPLPVEGAPNALEVARAAVWGSVIGDPKQGEVILRDLVPATWFAILCMLGTLAYESYWHRSSSKAVFLGKDCVAKIVGPAKKEAIEHGTWVSTGDVLVAWILKSMYLDNPSTNSLAVRGAVSTRSLLPGLDPYPHNAISGFTLPLIPIQDLPSISLSSLAQMHRRSVYDARSLEAVKGVCELAGVVNRVPRYGARQDTYLLSNQVAGRLTDLVALGELKGLWIWAVPLLPLHSVVINQIGAGFVVQGMMRSSRWENVRKAVEMF